MTRLSIAIANYRGVHELRSLQLLARDGARWMTANRVICHRCTETTEAIITLSSRIIVFLPKAVPFRLKVCGRFDTESNCCCASTDDRRRPPGVRHSGFALPAVSSRVHDWGPLYHRIRIGWATIDDLHANGCPPWAAVTLNDPEHLYSCVFIDI